MSAYYNEVDPYPAEWLRRLIDAGHIAPGTVDARSVLDVTPNDLEGFSQAHFFAGIGGWSHALRLAGVPDDANVWSGSCPCQPFSVAGSRRGSNDSRHLWPAWFRLIEACRPFVIFGEQVSSPHGLAWLDDVSTDLEGAGYTIGSLDLCAASVGAPHIRQRIFFVAVRLADADANGQRIERLFAPPNGDASSGDDAHRSGATLGMGHADGRRAGRDGRRASRAQSVDAREGNHSRGVSNPTRASSPVNGFWRRAEWLLCRDGKARPIEPRSLPLVDGLPDRVGKLRAYVNAIVAPLAAEFIRASFEAIGDHL